MTKQEIIETLKKEIVKGEYQMAGCLAVPLDFLKYILKELEGDETKTMLIPPPCVEFE